MESRRRSPIRVVLPLLTWVPGTMGGSETYVEELVSRLPQRDELDVRILLPGNAVGAVPLDSAVVAKSVRGGPSARQRLRAQVLAEGSSSARRSMTEANVVHYPFTVPSPRPQPGQVVVQSLHDTLHLDSPETISLAERQYRRFRYDRPARRAAAVLTVSQFCKRQIISNLGIHPERIHVTHLGVNAEEFTPFLGPRKPFVLYPARGWPHKNHSRLLRAMDLVRRSRPDLQLVLTGGGLEGLGALPDWVQVRGFVSRSELLALYRSASCLAFPSLYEGFGLPPLEAMSSGCPVTVATSGSLPEVCGDAALYFDAHDPRSMAEGILGALQRSTELTRLGLMHASKFTWEACVDKHVEVYQELAPSP
jgi:glycosyltransferase involved in cell wall biosynthesis